MSSLWFLALPSLHPCIFLIKFNGFHTCIYICVTLTRYIKGPPGTSYCIKAQLAGIYLSARPLTWESYDRYTLLRKPSLLLGNGDTNCIKQSCPNMVHMGDKALTLGHYEPLGLVLYQPYVPIGHDLCTYMGYICINFHHMLLKSCTDASA